MTDAELKAIEQTANPGTTIAYLCGELRAAREALQKIASAEYSPNEPTCIVVARKALGEE